MAEFDLIARYFAADDDGALVGVGDDAAVLATGPQTAVAVDTLVSGIHFPEDTPPAAVGHRALAVNLSDLAAMGATPRWMTLALTLPEVDDRWLAGFAQGLLDLARSLDVRLVGGDTTRGPLTVTVQLLGDADTPWLTRGGASAGDSVYVGATVGDAAGGLALWPPTTDASPHCEWLMDRFLYPTPQVALGQRLRSAASAAIDISDGLVADLAHLARASACDAHIEQTLLPLSEALVEHYGVDAATRFALTGGDDYVLCFTAASAELADTLPGVQRIGQLTAGTGQVFVDGERLEQEGYEHFAF